MGEYQTENSCTQFESNLQLPLVSKLSQHRNSYSNLITSTAYGASFQNWMRSDILESDGVDSPWIKKKKQNSRQHLHIRTSISSQYLKEWQRRWYQKIDLEQRTITSTNKVKVARIWTYSALHKDSLKYKISSQYLKGRYKSVILIWNQGQLLVLNWSNFWVKCNKIWIWTDLPRDKIVSQF